jgi:hypothetical protein
MMVIVAVVAVDCVVMRLASSAPPATPYLVLGGSLMQTALVIGLLLVFRQRRRMEKPNPFLVGFDLLGWIGHLVFVAACVLAAKSISSFMVDVVNLLLGARKGRPHSAAEVILIFGLITSCLTAPQLAIALVGGWINRRWSEQTHPEPVPHHE